MGISPDNLIRFYPQLFHMAEYGTWESISQNGLLSTTALLDMFGITGRERLNIESSHRPESVSIIHGSYGTAVIRDQKPMSEAALRKCLINLSPKQWYETLNRKVFFWLTSERLLRLLSARAYRGKRHCVLTVNTERLLRLYLGKITLSPINSGNTLYRSQPRGAETFLPLNKYPFDVRRKLRGRMNAIAELAVDYHVLNIEKVVEKVEHMQAERVIEILFQNS